MNIIIRIFPLTKTGILFISAAFIILFMGIINSDLAAMFWASSILTIITIAYILNHLAFQIIKRKAGSINIKIPVKPVFPGNTINIQLETELSKIFIPGIIIIFRISFHWENRNPLTFSQILKTGQSIYTLHTAAERRGFFESNQFEFVIRDYFGFFKSKVYFDINEKIPVFPKQKPTEKILKNFKGIDSTNYLKAPVPADEFYEVRKYYPGDDPKKINWKMYAHTNELFIRKKEETPPPKSNILFIIDLFKTQIINNKYSDKYLDDFVETVCGIILLYLNDYWPVMIYISGYNSIYSINSKYELLTLFSRLYWHDNTALDMPSLENHVSAVLFSTADSANLKYLINTIINRNWDINLFFKLLEPHFTDYKTISFKNFFYYHNSTDKITDHKYLEKVNKSIINRTNRLTKHPWNLTNVKTI